MGQGPPVLAVGASRHAVDGGLGALCVVRLEEDARRHRGKLVEQEPRPRQVVEEADAEDRVEPPELLERGALEVGFDERHVVDLQEALDELRTRDVPAASLDREDPLDPAREREGVRAFEAPELEHASGRGKRVEEAIDPPIVDEIGLAAVVDGRRCGTGSPTARVT